MDLPKALLFYNITTLTVLITGILSLIISIFLIRQFIAIRKWYKLQIILLLSFNSFNMCFRYLKLTNDSKLVNIVANWLQVITILLFEWVQYNLLKLVCVASTFWTVQKVEYLKFTIIFITAIGFTGLICSKVTYMPGDGSVMDKWNRFGSTVVTALAQVCSLCQGIYMTFLMKTVCVFKDEKAMLNFDKYVKRSYWMLGYFVISNVLCGIAYIVGVFIRGPDGSPNGYNYQSFSSISTIFLSNEILGLVFLFESIKAMKFGSDVDRIKSRTKEKTRR